MKECKLNQTIAKLDLEPILVKLMDKDEGMGWDLEYAKLVEVEYKKFLTLCLEYPKNAIVPSLEVDKFWHYHILDTMKYADDCENIFGYFLHHFPYFGMRGDEDLNNLNQAWQETCEIYINRFGEPKEIVKEQMWSKFARCPNCGRGIESESKYTSLKRPRLASKIA